MELNEMKEILVKYNQEHILKAYERLDEEGKLKLLEQISKIDFEQMKKLYALTKGEVEFENTTITPIAFTDSKKLSPDEKSAYIKIGEQIIKDGKLAVVTMAGGQGTRLGHNGPKGTFILDEPINKSLFEILTENIKKASDKYSVSIPWYIMTSRENNDDTVKFFEENNYFDYTKENIRMFFKQSELPMIDEAGKLMIDEDGFIKEAADGHGGVFEALFKNGALEDMKQKGIEWIFIGGVDNPLVNMTDPLFIGFTAKENYLAASKTIMKGYPKEKVGVFCKKNGKPYVIEYTEISDELASQRREDGELVYGESHVLLNLFNIEILNRIKDKKLPYHVAHKKANYIDEEGKLIMPEAPNAYKFETFIFDAFSFMDDVGLLRSIREEEFAPVKNATGTDSPETARKLYLDYHSKKGD